MTSKALVYTDTQQSCDVADRLVKACEQADMDTRQVPLEQNADSFRATLPASPAVVFLPVMSEDCLGVKLAQIAKALAVPHVVVLYADALPAGEYLCLAFREGLDDVIALDACDDAVQIQVNRAARLLRERLDTPRIDGHSIEDKLKSLEATCRQLSRRNSKWQERIQLLATTAGRIITGELQLAGNNPYLLVVSGSKSQASSATQLALRLGFDAKTVHSGRDALNEVRSRVPEVILTDGTLPDMDATALAAEVRKTSEGKRVAIIVWSSNPDAEDIFLAPDSGVDDFVPKSSSSESGNLLVAALLGGLQ